MKGKISNEDIFDKAIKQGFFVHSTREYNKYWIDLSEVSDIMSANIDEFRQLLRKHILDNISSDIDTIVLATKCYAYETEFRLCALDVLVNELIPKLRKINENMHIAHLRKISENYFKLSEERKGNNALVILGISYHKDLIEKIRRNINIKKVLFVIHVDDQYKDPPPPEASDYPKILKKRGYDSSYDHIYECFFFDNPEKGYKVRLCHENIPRREKFRKVFEGLKMRIKMNPFASVFRSAIAITLIVESLYIFLPRDSLSDLVGRIRGAAPSVIYFIIIGIIATLIARFIYQYAEG